MFGTNFTVYQRDLLPETQKKRYLYQIKSLNIAKKMATSERNRKRQRTLTGMNENREIDLINIKIQNQFRESKVFPPLLDSTMVLFLKNFGFCKIT